MALNSQRKSQGSISGLSKDFSEMMLNRRSMYMSEDDNSSCERKAEQQPSAPKLKSKLDSKRFNKGTALGFGAMLNTAS